MKYEKDKETKITAAPVWWYMPNITEDWVFRFRNNWIVAERQFDAIHVNCYVTIDNAFLHRTNGCI